MKKIKIEFECKHSTNINDFLEDLMFALDNWNDTELDKCSSFKLIKG